MNQFISIFFLTNVVVVCLQKRLTYVGLKAKKSGMKHKSFGTKERGGFALLMYIVTIYAQIIINPLLH